MPLLVWAMVGVDERISRARKEGEEAREAGEGGSLAAAGLPSRRF